MRAASFAIEKGAQQAEVAVMPFPGMGGTDLQFVNLWREQMKLPPTTQEELGKFTERIVVGELPGRLFDMSGDSAQSKDRIVVAIVPRQGITWFFKLAGDGALVAQEKAAFIEFLKSVEFTEATTETTTSTSAAPRPAGMPAWEVPPSWKEQAPGDMILSSFAATDDAGNRVDITVSRFGGPAGGVQANVNRWRGQLGLGPASDDELAKLPTLDVAGGRATLVDVSGVNAKTGKPGRLVGVIVPRGGQTWFFKLIGHDAVAQRERENFVKFVQSVKFSDSQ